MADRYWVGGAGTWNNSNTANWSTSSGGASGASAPTASDNIIFDQNGPYTVSMGVFSSTIYCQNLTVTGTNITFNDAVPSYTIEINGGLALASSTTWSANRAINFKATGTSNTITTNGVNVRGAINFTGLSSASWTLGSDYISTASSINVVIGTFDTGGYSLQTGSISTTSSANPKIINLGSSTVTLNTTVAPINFAVGGSNTTFNAGTSQINCTGACTQFITSGVSSGDATFYNVAFTSTTARIIAFTGSQIFNNLAITGPATAGYTGITFSSNKTINGVLSTTGTAGNRRIFIVSSTSGLGWSLTCNSTPSLTDVDFRDIFIYGTAAPVSGTRLGNRGSCQGIAFVSKNVYWNLAGAQSWSANGWCAASGGTPSTDYFPLPQDTAVFDNTGSVTGTITLDSLFTWVPTVDMSTRTSAMTIAFSNTKICYGSWKNGSGTTLTGSSTLTFSGGTTQSISGNGITFPNPITIDTLGGLVQLADNLDIGANTLTVSNGTFSAQSYSLVAGSISSATTTSIRTINLNTATITLSAATPLSLAALNLTLNAGTSQINITNTAPTFSGVGLTFYNVAFTSTAITTASVTGENTFNNLTFTAPSAAVSIILASLAANQIINGTLNCAGASGTQRVFLQSSVANTQRTLTVNSLSASDCNFRDIVITGAAAGSSPTRAGNCGNNSGITFPAPKTVYWNLAGAQNWSATGWCTSSGGTPAVNNFPLAQDTAVFDNVGAAGTVTLDAAWFLGTFDASARTAAMTFSTSTFSPLVFGDWKWGTGVTSSVTTGNITFSKLGTQTITCNGVSFGCAVVINQLSSYVQLADNLIIDATKALQLISGTFDAVSYNVTTGIFSNASTSNTLKMGSGTWTISGTGTVWSCASAPIMYSGTSNIVLSDTSTTARTFAGGSSYYNKLTIGGATGTSTLTISGANTFGELASTKTVVHTIEFPQQVTTTIGTWSVAGPSAAARTNIYSTFLAAPNRAILSLSGATTSAANYLYFQYIAISTTSFREFYSGAGSQENTGSNSGALFFTAPPTPRTLYWVGGTGNWSSTTKWATSSGGASGAAIPTSLDSVTFDSASNATGYTATIDAGVTIARCAAFTMAGPASGNVTFTGSVSVAFHGNVSFAATGIINSYTGTINLASGSSYTFTTNGLTFASATTVRGIGSTWTLGSSFSTTSTYTVTFGTSNLNGFSLTCSDFSSLASAVRTISLGSSTVNLSANTGWQVALPNLTLNAGTSTITNSASSASFDGAGLTYYNYSVTSGLNTTYTIASSNTFNNLSISGLTSAGSATVSISANQTINGTLTVSAGTTAACRTRIYSSSTGTTRTLTCAAVSLTDADFSDITIAGAASPASGTRLGNARNNSGITFSTAKNVYWATTTSGNWSDTAWSLTSGGAADLTAFPLPQDTAIFPAATYPASGSTVTLNGNYNIGTIDMSLRTSNTVTLDTGTTTPTIFGNWINGTGSTVTGTGIITFKGRNTQQLTGAGVAITQPITINSPGGTVQLQDAFTTSAANAVTLTNGTLDLNGKTLTAGSFSSSNSNTRVLTFGAGTFALASTGTIWDMSTSTGATVNRGTGTISLTDTSTATRTFAGGGLSYPKLSIGGITGTSTLAFSGVSTFTEITSIKTVAHTIDLGGGQATVSIGKWSVTGTIGNLVTISGNGSFGSALIYTGTGIITGVDYLVVSNLRGFSSTQGLTGTWAIGSNSVNGGSAGFIFAVDTPPTEAFTISDSSTQVVIYNLSITELLTAGDAQAIVYATATNIVENITQTDSSTQASTFLQTIAENTNMADNTQVAGWVKITDDQTANWATINNSETANWTVVSTTNNAGWQNTNNLQ
jgi:hypothetical protein